MARVRARVLNSRTLASGRCTLREYSVEYRCRDGARMRLRREACHRGDSAVVLPYSRRRGTVVLTRQFRLPPFVGGQVDGMLLEAPGGLLDGQRPAEAARREVEEETGWRLGPLTEVCVLYMSPAVMTERVHCFVANVDEGARLVHRRPRADEGEDVEVLELPFATALRMVTSGEIVDGRTIVLLQFAELQALVGCL